VTLLSGSSGSGAERPDGMSDEHRLVNIVSPPVLPGAERHRLAVVLQTRRERRPIAAVRRNRRCEYRGSYRSGRCPR
jgi:hypothetical protein